MNTLQHSVVHRLPQSYRWSAGQAGIAVEPLTLGVSQGEDDLIGLRLLSHNGARAWEIMYRLQETLADIQLLCSVVEWQGDPCLFVQRNDEHATTCRLKNFGVGIAEFFPGAG
ncbi:hypothetical protein BL250_04835 [Erwinia sp. OLTSP20]|uniref:YejG family protein n=1 Tax=unclassified Erwinia TaxID=2622719 RepID=UPI000C19C268|nr:MULTISPECIES: YejG family protein [unclassified Erwinia]PIJ49451.1 hypothetical protein BV501_12740 [Erwinia sp. OAMSP11]PIJ68982.1 hypothetical protein BK416_15620 [Erwinia sp. OLSSP12]PIJ80982.1 hypothetical protein BLD46_13535 [Erwinia sp. OLMTSP26]PIJ83385.1 hypothetical protein BLD49_13220 [Erwinia sp. OLMDSP33]PIJ84298.1 hypothetical protein BLD47_02855 [Erwinia sp. OLCASP19]